jgi:hypothetical protein
MGEAKRRREARQQEEARRRLVESLDDPSTTIADDLAFYAQQTGRVTAAVRIRLPGMKSTTTVTATGNTRAAARRNAERGAAEMAGMFRRIVDRQLAEMPVAGSA